MTELHLLSRSVIFGCFVVLAVCSYFVARLSGAGKCWALLAPFLIVAQFDFAFWNVSARPDVPALCFEMLALLVVVGAGERLVSWSVAGAAMAAAGLMKQSAVAALLAVCTWAIMTRRYRQALVLLLTTAAVGFSVLGLFLVRGEPVLSNLFSLAGTPAAWGEAAATIVLDFYHNPIQVAFLAVALTAVWNWRYSSRPNRLLILQFVIAWTMVVATSWSAGADRNYFFEGWVAAALLAPFGVLAVVEGWERAPEAIRVAICLVLVGLISLGVFTWLRIIVLPKARPHFNAELTSMVRSRHILSDIPFYAAYSRSPEVVDANTLHVLERRGKWSPDSLLNNIIRHQYEYIIIGIDDGKLLEYRGMARFSTSIRRTIGGNYSLACVAQDVAVLIPQGQALLSMQSSQLRSAGCSPVVSLDTAVLLDLPAGIQSAHGPLNE